MIKLKDILQELNLNSSNGLYYFNKNWGKQVKIPSRIKRIFEKKLKPTAFFCFDNKPLLLFFENPSNKEELHRKIWNFNETPIVIIVEEAVVEIFNGFKLADEVSGLLEKIGGYEELNDFTFFELVTGKTWEKYQSKIKYQDRVDYKLLSNIRDTRELILKKFPKTKNKERKKQYIKITNALLGKIIFVRYLIDRKVKLDFDNKPKIWDNDDLCNLLRNQKRTKQFFDYLTDPEKGFNGDLFPLTSKEYTMIPKGAYEKIISLLKSEDIGTGQASLFDLYDFSIIPIEFISNIYESFIGIENQAKEGAYYTPLFLVDYVLSETIIKAIKRNKYSDCKILDPACGSGVFLVESLRKLIEQYFISNEGKLPKVAELKRKLRDIVKDNIFGIDKDESAIQVAIFSVYLTLLDYMEPPDISSFKFPKLLGSNFFQSNFFDTEAEFNIKLKEKQFSFIIGNPPWKRGDGEEESLFVNYVNKRRQQENPKGDPFIEIGNREIAQAFLLRSSDFSNKATKCSLIVTSKVLYNLQSANFRKYFLHNYFIDHVFELAPVRREVFNNSNKKAISPACVLFFRYAHGKNTDLNIIRHIALKPSRFFFLFKIFTVSRQDIQYIQQDKLKMDDWMWKILVYGSYLDFNFIKRLKTEFKSIHGTFDEKTLVKQGIKRVDGSKKIDASKLYEYDFLDLEKEIKQFFINPKHTKWELSEVGYAYQENGSICEDIFSPPMLLIKETVNTSLESISAISSQKLVFTDKITSVKFRGERSIDEYYLLAGLMNSSLFAYYVFQSSSTAGIMIEQQINDSERFSFPYIYSSEIIQYTKEIEALKEETEFMFDDDRQKKINTKKQNINKNIYELLSLNDIEKSLVDYNKNIMIPMIMKHKGYENIFFPCVFNDNLLQEYAQLFIERFKNKFQSIEKKMIVEIWYTEQIIGMFFKIVKEKENKDAINWRNMQNDNVLQCIAELAIKKLTEQLFIQKDIRGFEKEGFYIFKPNEKRLWHKAIGYLDINEFIDAMHKAEW